MKIVDFAVKILKQYAKETCTIQRSTSDLSGLEEYLIIKLFKIKMKAKVKFNDVKVGDKVIIWTGEGERKEVTIAAKANKPGGFSCGGALAEYRGRYSFDAYDDDIHYVICLKDILKHIKKEK